MVQARKEQLILHNTPPMLYKGDGIKVNAGANIDDEMFRGRVGESVPFVSGCAGDRRMVPRVMPRTLETLQ